MTSLSLSSSWVNQELGKTCLFQPSENLQGNNIWLVLKLIIYFINFPNYLSHPIIKRTVFIKKKLNWLSKNIFLISLENALHKEIRCWMLIINLKTGYNYANMLGNLDKKDKTQKEKKKKQKSFKKIHKIWRKL